MSRIALNDTPFEGVSRSVTYLHTPRRRVSCLHCGSALTANRYEGRRWSTVLGVAYEVDLYRCGCGRGRQVRRETAG